MESTLPKRTRSWGKRCNGRLRICQLVMVEQLEEPSAELNSHTLSGRKGFEPRQIHVQKFRTGKDVLSRVAPSKGSGLGESVMSALSSGI